MLDANDFSGAEWHGVTADPAHCRELELLATGAGYPVSWVNRQGMLWQIQIHCLDEQMAELQSQLVAGAV